MYIDPIPFRKDVTIDDVLSHIYIVNNVVVYRKLVADQYNNYNQNIMQP